MKIFDYSAYENMLWDKEILGLVAEIHEHRGRQELFLLQKTARLQGLVEVAKIQSTEASNRIEGILTTSSRLGDIMRQKTTPRNRAEEEIAGYRDVLNTIHTSHEYIKLTPNVILQLHRDLYKYSAHSSGGKYKHSDNIIQEISADGSKTTRFEPLAAYLAPSATQSICTEYNALIAKGSMDELLLLPIFILDFLCIHPFGDGNGRISRLLTLLLLYKSNYSVGKYISLEKITEKTKDHYYAALQASSCGWQQNQNDVKPFLRYMLGVILSAYRDFEERVLSVSLNLLSKTAQIKEAIQNKIGKITKSELRVLCPNISEPMIEKTLKDLLNEGFISKIGSGKNTGYIKT